MTANGYTGSAAGAVAISDVTGLTAALAAKLPLVGGTVTGGLVVDGILHVGTSVTLEIGADTNLYRVSANHLATDDSLDVGGDLLVYGNVDLQGNITGVAVADVSGLQTALDLKMNAAAAEVVNSTLVVRKADWSAALRLRSTGSAVDIDKSNGDVVISNFLGTPEDAFSSTQTGLARLRANGITFSGGLIEFGSTVYAGEQSINTATGAASFGALGAASAGVTGNATVGGTLGVTGATTLGALSASSVTGGALNHNVRAADHSLAGWTFDPTGVQAATVLSTAGVSHIVRIRVTGTLITNILIHMTVGGSTLTAGQCFAELFTDAGTRLASTADQATAWTSAGMKTMPLVTPQAVTSGAWYKVRFWFNGTTGPTLSRGINSSSAILNAGLSTPNFRFSTADTGLTTAALAVTTIGTQTGTATGWWVGLS